MDAISIITFFAILAFLILLFSMTLLYGTLSSISQLAGVCKNVLLVALWSQALLLPKMMEITLSGWLWLPFLGIFAIIICGGANIFNKEDSLVHMIAAAIAFTCLTGWVMIIKSPCLMPLIVCAIAGRENIIWRLEVGLIASVYTLLILYI